MTVPRGDISSPDDDGAAASPVNKPATTGAFGPRTSVAVAVAEAVTVTAAPGGKAPASADPAHRSGRQVGAVTFPRAHSAPAGDADGVLSHRSAADGGGVRHGDAQAVAVQYRTPVRLTPGSAAQADTAATQERHRDIPVFPG
ncbi:hypothetical protein ACIQAC_12970 [Streptomyces sp. NPDC088387]|uniref:hypothetical protein n=1 Tax=Streptomyces sp. NPDC088387 TaxID=3365859 RepID=UPI003826B5C9